MSPDGLRGGGAGGGLGGRAVVEGRHPLARPRTITGQRVPAEGSGRSAESGAAEVA